MCAGRESNMSAHGPTRPNLELSALGGDEPFPSNDLRQSSGEIGRARREQNIAAIAHTVNWLWRSSCCPTVSTARSRYLAAPLLKYHMSNDDFIARPIWWLKQLRRRAIWLWCVNDLIYNLQEQDENDSLCPKGITGKLGIWDKSKQR